MNDEEWQAALESSIEKIGIAGAVKIILRRRTELRNCMKDDRCHDLADGIYLAINDVCFAADESQR